MANKLDLARAQFIGFCLGAHGSGIKELASSMGLTKSEWEQLRDMSYLNEQEKKEVDEYINKIKQ